MIGTYDITTKKYTSEISEDDFYCGKQLNILAISLKRLKDGDITLQEAYDDIVNDIIMAHVIRNSNCECKDYLHKLEEELCQKTKDTHTEKTNQSQKRAQRP